MRKLYFRLLLFGLIFSCSQKGEDEIYQGKIEELLLDDFSLEKDSLTRGFGNLNVIHEGGKDYLIYSRSARKFKGYGFVFLNAQTGKEEHVVEIPFEGPNSMKGGVAGFFVHDKNTIFLVSGEGDIATYDSLGNQTSYVDSELDIPLTIDNWILIEYRWGLANFDYPSLQFGQNPSHMVNGRDKPGAGEIRYEFPLDFRNWLTHTNVTNGEIETSDFLIPTGYEIFQGDMTSTFLFGDYDSKRDRYLLGWPYSNEVYELKGLSLEQKVIPKTSLEFNFLPSEPLAVQGDYPATAMVQPKDASKHIFIMYDSYRDLNIRCSKIKESGTGETKFQRTKHYVLSIYSGDWKPKGEYFFDFETELDVENWFLTSEGLFINKPEQESEDAYEFYKIDLSGFVD
ncbi:hypothetical protein SYJ56_16610 [Algoriphagus sp. D3-2-R+10]|uniref:hypothetical protein n=1 Tax=Algoriphagus aurantiacus TaxID=3103948 RepID=UPI002B3AD3A5|nr:hypothetical protein [Algoriphagus sp. D3-2-R+10]MEB2776940.1 hypothetical protein [Algoriphagus sp. D3-2-R+10]